jgi:hypothetical protein
MSTGQEVKCPGEQGLKGRELVTLYSSSHSLVPVLAKHLLNSPGLQGAQWGAVRRWPSSPLEERNQNQENTVTSSSEMCPEAKESHSHEQDT